MLYYTTLRYADVTMPLCFRYAIRRFRYFSEGGVATLLSTPLVAFAAMPFRRCQAAITPLEAYYAMPCHCLMHILLISPFSLRSISRQIAFISPIFLSPRRAAADAMIPCC